MISKLYDTDAWVCYDTIGGALALSLADAGADVLATIRNVARISEISEEITSLNRKTFPVLTDATSADDMRLMF